MNIKYKETIFVYTLDIEITKFLKEKKIKFIKIKNQNDLNNKVSKNINLILIDSNLISFNNIKIYLKEIKKFQLF